MEDQDLTLKLPKFATPPMDGLANSQIQNLFAVGAGAFADQPTSPTRHWQPPTVEQLQQALPQYEITSLIARGGMGAVYKGTQTALKRTVAIKVLPPEMEDADMQFAARFKQEAQSMAQLSHPNIVAVFDAGEVVVGRVAHHAPFPESTLGERRLEDQPPHLLLYFVMEFVEGTDVAQLIASEGRIEPQRAIQIITAVCEALAFAHEEGIIHRDIKPSNIMIDRKGRVKVADFGLAKAVNLESTLLTGSNVAMGTPDFIAPEAMMPGMKVDGRADLYAVGVMLYQMLTGKIPRGRFELPSRVIPLMDKGFDAIVDKAMQTDRENRYSTATEMRVDVERVFQLVPSTSPDTSAQRTNQEIRSATSRRKPLLLSVGAVILAAGTFVALKQPQDSGPSKVTTAATPKNITAPPRPAELKPAQIVYPPKKAPAPFSLEQWHQLFPTPLPDVWERSTIYQDGLLFVKSAGGFPKPMPSADGAIRAVVHIKTTKDTPGLFGRFSDTGGYYQATWDVERAAMLLTYYATGTGKGYEHLCSRTMPGDMVMKVGDVLKLELRLEGDNLTALTNDKPLLDFHHDKLKTPGSWGIKSNTGGWFESVEIEPIPPPFAQAAPSAAKETSSSDVVSATTKVESIWKARWHTPGKLQAAGTDMNGKPFDLTAAEPFDDFVQVAAVEPGYYSGRAWVGLRAQGNLVWSDGLVERGRIGLIRTPTGVISIAAGGNVSLPPLTSPEPVTDVSAASLNGLPDKVWVMAYADVSGVWHIFSSAFGSGVLERPDITSGPRVTQIVVGSAGIGVLRKDGTLHLWNEREMRLPESLAHGVRSVGAMGNQWAVLKDEGRILVFTMAKATNAGPQMLLEPSAIRESITHDKFLASALASGGHAPLAKLTDGRWTTGSTGIVEDTLKTLHAEDNESFSVIRSKEAGGILWINPSK